MLPVIHTLHVLAASVLFVTVFFMDSHVPLRPAPLPPLRERRSSSTETETGPHRAGTLQISVGTGRPRWGGLIGGGGRLRAARGRAACWGFRSKVPRKRWRRGSGFSQEDDSRRGESRESWGRGSGPSGSRVRLELAGGPLALAERPLRHEPPASRARVVAHHVSALRRPPFQTIPPTGTASRPGLRALRLLGFGSTWAWRWGGGRPQLNRLRLVFDS